MTDIPEFEAPSWLNSQDAATINQRMMDNLPAGLNRTKGELTWDLTMPTALEKAELLQFHLMEALKVIHPFWARGQWLDLLGREVDTPRNEAEYAAGMVTVKGVPGTIIPKDFTFATKANAAVSSKLYITLETAEIDENGSVDISIKANTAGADGNTAADTVCLMLVPMEGITSITNKDIVTGGADIETDDSYRKRIIEAERNGSFTGCDSDYVRWALEIAGVGRAYVEPLWNGPGTVKLMISDINGGPANEELIERVFNHIQSPGNRANRLNPICAELTVDTVRFYGVDIKFNITVVTGTTEERIARISDTFKTAVMDYLQGEARDTMSISYNKIRALLRGIEDVTAITQLYIIPRYGNNTVPLEIAEVVAVPKGFYPELGTFARGADL